MHGRYLTYIKIDEDISFSVIIPVYKNCSTLKKCLFSIQRAVCNTKYPTEVIVVDDCSPNNIEIKNIVLDFKYTYLELKKHAGPAKARNYGSEKSQNNILVFIDSDVLIEVNHFNILGDFFKYQDKYIAVIGLYNPGTRYINFYSTFKNLQHHYIHKTSKFDTSVFFTGCGAIYKNIFLKFKGFDISYKDALIEDVDLGSRLKKHGYRIYLHKKLIVNHLKIYSFSSLFISDVFHRAVPLTIMLSKYKHIENDQDIKLEAILSTSWIAANIIVFSFFFPIDIITLLFAPAIIIGVGILNIGFLRFVLTQRGYIFTIKSLLYLCFYYLYCGFGLILGIIYLLIKKVTNEK